MKLFLARYLFRKTIPLTAKLKEVEALPISKSVAKISSERDILSYPDYFHVASLFTVEDLFNARVHLGHKEGSLNQFMKPYLYGSRLGHLIFDLDQTAEHLRRALNFIAHIAFHGGIILFVCRSAQHQFLVEKTAMECGAYAHTRLWINGTLTNSEIQFGQLTRLPDLVIFVSTLAEGMVQHWGIVEAAKMLIPSVGIVDSNCCPRIITYPVPGNDDSAASVELYCKLFKKVILLGKEKRTELTGS